MLTSQIFFKVDEIKLFFNDDLELKTSFALRINFDLYK